MNFRTLLIVFVAIQVCSIEVFGQQTEQDKIQQLEQLNAARRLQEQASTLDSAISLMREGKYELADSRFTSLLRKVKAVSSDLAFYFGENSLYLGKYRQSIDWLTKYIQLKGTTGTHSQEAVLLLKKAEDAILSEVRQQHQEVAVVLSRDFDIDCGPAGKVVCPVCSGKTVIIKKDYLTERFSSCPYCDQHGFLTCEQYNKLLRGQLNRR